MFLYAILGASVLLAIGLALRANLRVLQVLYIPAAVVAGVVGLGVVQSLARWDLSAEFTAAIVKATPDWLTIAIAVVFAGLLLERSKGKGLAEALRRGARSGVLAWVIILGQIVVGLVVYLLLVRPFHPDVPAVFGQLLEVSWAGGHGASTAMGDVYSAVGFPLGRDLALFLATVGLVYGVLSGLVLVNIAIRRGWTSGGAARGGIPIVTGIEPPDAARPIAFARTRGEVMEPMVLQAVLLALAFGVGFALQQAFIGGAEAVLGQNTDKRGEAIDFAMNTPLFLFTLLGGLLVRVAMTAMRIDHLIDNASVQRLVGLAMEFLIVGAVATLRIEAVFGFIVPLVALVVAAGAWSAFCLLVLAPRLLPKGYWFELGLLNYGFSTANTPQGLMLLRIVDPAMKSGAAEDYAVAAPLSAPFVGGGVVTIVGLPLLLQQVHAGVVAGGLVVIIMGLIVLGALLARGEHRAG